MKIKKLLLVLVLGMFSLTIFSQTKRIKKWQSDIEFLKTELPIKHKNLFFEKEKEYYENELDAIIQRLDQLADYQIALKIQQVIASMGDAHTSIQWKKYIEIEKKIPIRTIWFDGGLFIFQTNKENDKLLGKRIVKINDYPIAKIIDSLSTLISVDNQAVLKTKIPKLLAYSDLYKFFGFANSDVFKIDVESVEGRKYSYKVAIEKYSKEKRAMLMIKKVPYYLKNTRAYLRYNYFINDKIYYIQYNKCLTKRLALSQGNKKLAKKLVPFATYQKKIFAEIESNDVDKVIFDMRMNSGGDSKQGRLFIEEIAKNDKLNKKDKLFVVVGRETYSSAVINTLSFKELTNATIIGEETSGMPNHYGEIKHFILPKNSIRVTYSSRYFHYTDEEMKTIVPDVIIESSFTDFNKGVDPIYEWVKEQ